MVSFSCEGCGDVLTKKKLDAHRNQCRSATFTCLDCMKHFQGTDYRLHTSCISEDQRYQGALYKEKPAKQSKKSVKISASQSSEPRKAYVEDVPDIDTGNAIAIVSAPPEAPVPPTAAPSLPEPVNVFDFLVTEDTPNASKTFIADTKNTRKMVEHAPSIIDSELSYDQANSMKHDPAYDKYGFSYGADPVPTPYSRHRPKVEYLTPAPKDLHKEMMSMDNGNSTSKKSTDKKRKRLHVEDLDLTAARRPSQEPSDATMSDAPAPVLHSGLTGGLTRLLSKSKYPPSPSYSEDNRSPLSPVKRSKPTDAKDRSRKKSSSAGVLALVRNRRTSDESRPRKHHRSHRHESRDDSRHHKQKAIEYHKPSSSSHLDPHQQVILYKSRAELFMSFVTKGPDSEQGCSINKALKRYHRERSGSGEGKAEEEKELWKGLRLKRNDRGEVVVFF